MPHTVVFDTNILFSGLAWQGNPFHCLQLARSGKVTTVTCKEIMEELEEKLRLKRQMSPAEAARAVAEVLLFSRVITIPNALHVVLADPADDKIIECAVVSGATHIVTGDRRHLLPLGSHQGVAIVSATDFLTLVSMP